MNRKVRVVTVLTVLAVAGSVAQGGAQDVSPGARVGFNPQPDPPGFGLIPLDTNQTVRLNVVCYAHQIGRLPPDPCRGELMFHDAAGSVLKRGFYDLRPGHSAVLAFTRPGDAGASRMSIMPCVLPAPGGRAIPSVEVFDAATRRMVLFANPAAARMSDFNDGLRDPGARVGFNPQPDPPGFGLVTIAIDQIARLNVVCFEHRVDHLPPDPCRGEVMFHDAVGGVLTEASYDLRPGESMVLEFVPPVTDLATNGFIINPCVVPAPGGRAVPDVEVVDGPAGRTTLLINPAAARVSEFAR